MLGREKIKAEWFCPLLNCEPRLPTTLITNDLPVAAEWLREGKLVAFPTETVFGLGVDATNTNAVEKLFLAKGRPSDNPLIVHLADIDCWPMAARELNPTARIILESFAPGPLTVVVPKLDSISRLVTAGLDTVGIRVPAHETARELLRLTGRPIAAPSANRSGKPSCTTWQSVREDMDGRIDGIVRGDACRVGLESTVVQCLGDRPIVLRAGSVTLEQIQRVVSSAISVDQLSEVDTLSKASPGTRHAHYQPQARVVLFEHADELAAISQEMRSLSAAAVLSGTSSSAESLKDFPLVARYDCLESYAKGFYELLREVDRRNLQRVYLQLAPEHAMGIALRDRQIRAAGQSRTS